MQQNMALGAGRHMEEHAQVQRDPLAMTVSVLVSAAAQARPTSGGSAFGSRLIW